MRGAWACLLVACVGPEVAPVGSALRVGGESDPFLNLVWTVEGAVASSDYGKSAAFGDVNGDGFDDVIVGAPRIDLGLGAEGQALIYLGSAGGPDLSPAWSAASGQAGATFGSAVAAADVNGDGYDDVIVGASNFANGAIGEGAAFAYHGSAGGVSPTAAWMVEGGVVGGHLGATVAAAGDVNLDGYEDVLVGAPDVSNGFSFEGRVSLYLGSAFGLAATPAWTAEGESFFARLGSALGRAGDVNGDTFDDVIVGAESFSNSNLTLGRAHVYHGSPSGLTAAPAWVAIPENPLAEVSQSLFGASVSAAGDVDADGYDDVVVGAPEEDGAVTSGGAAYLFRGSASGLEATPTWRVEGTEQLGKFGSSVAGAGDVDGDGHDDVVIAEAFERSALLFRGEATGLATIPAWWEVDAGLPSFEPPALAGGGDVDGDGRSDVLVGAPLSGAAAGGLASLYAGGCLGETVDGDGDGVPDACDACPGVDDDVYDVDHDGACAPEVDGAPVDCDDADPYVYPGAEERCDGVDNACVGLSPDETDLDGDGSWLCDGDYDDDPNAVLVRSGSIEPGAEVCALCGLRVASADVNGDGRSDIVIGGDGYAEVYDGATFEVVWSDARADMDYGAAVASAGDVNGDGYDDVIVGAPLGTNNEPYEGRAYLFLGSGAGLDTNPAWIGESDQFLARYGWSVAWPAT